MSYSPHKFLAKGTYGCIVKPGIVCHNYKLRDTKFKNMETISKLFTNEEEWNNEIKIQKVIETEIDKQGDFTIKMLDFCKKPSSIVKEIKDFYKCDSFNPTSNNKILQIVYPYAGIDLDNLVNKFNNPQISFKFNIRKALPYMLNLFEGIEKMVFADYVHYDIKINNILYDPTNNKFYLIDFGFCVKKKDTYDYKSFLFEDDYVPSFTFYPVEYNLMYYAYQNNLNYSKEDAKKLNLFKLCQQLMPLLNRIINDNSNRLHQKLKDKIAYVKNTLKIYLENCSKIIYEFKDASKYKLKPTKNDIDTYLAYLSLEKSVNKVDIRYKIDVYMFGFSLLFFLLCAINNLDEQNGILKIPLELFDLILKMVDSNPFTRISIQEAIIEYKRIFLL